MSEILVTVYDRTNGEEDVGTYRAVVAPRIGELLCVQAMSFNAEETRETAPRILRIEEVYWMAMPAHDVHAVARVQFKPRALTNVTVFGRSTAGPFKP